MQLTEKYEIKNEKGFYKIFYINENKEEIPIKYFINTQKEAEELKNLLETAYNFGRLSEKIGD